MGKRICTAHSAYGCGHHQEHVEAARKGWITRRRGMGTPERDDATWFRELFPGAEHIHTHPSHAQLVTFKQGDKWYELPTREFAQLAREGRAAGIARQKAEARAARLAEQERKAGERARVVENRKRAREIHAQYAWEVSMAKLAEKESRATWREIDRDFRKAGIRDDYERKEVRYSKGKTGKALRAKWVTKHSGEYRDLPAEWRKRNGKYTMDEARNEVSQRIASVSGGTDDALQTYSDFMDWIYQQQNGSDRYHEQMGASLERRDRALAALAHRTRGNAA